MSSPHVVFVTHDASRTGAPIFLLHLLEWLRQNTDCSFELICQRGGPLLSRFRRICPVTTYRLRRRMCWLAPLMIWKDANWLRARVARSRPDLVYYNTVASRDVHQGLEPLNLPTIVHVHELESSIAYYGADTMARVERSRPEYIAASGAVAKNLAERHAIPCDRLRVVHEFIRLPEDPADDLTSARAALCARLGIPDNSILVGGAGSIVRRKGVDLFVEAARQVRDESAGSTRPVHFLWLGGWMDRRFGAEIRETVRREGLSDVIHFLGQVERPAETMRHLDVFALTSREDPYPLVMLEAGALGVPVVGFAGSGGAPEFIEADAGMVVPGEDATALAGAIRELVADPARARAMGAAAAAKVRVRHTAELAATQILNAIARRATRPARLVVEPARSGSFPSPSFHPAQAC